MKKTACLFPFVLLIMNLAAIHLFAANGIIPGSGTADDPYLIEDFQDFMVFADFDYTNKYCSSRVHVSLMTDIDLSPELPGRQVFSDYVIQGGLTGVDLVFVPEEMSSDCEPTLIEIFESSNLYEQALDVPDFGILSSSIFNTVYVQKFGSGFAFAGTFWGNGHKISNVMINKDSDNGEGCGLFSTILDTGAVYDLSVENITISGYCNRVGGICSANEGIIDNCMVSGQMVSEFQGYSFGGITGVNLGTINGCSSNIDILSFAYAGGICGINDGVVYSCNSAGTVMATEAAGGISGSNGHPVNNIYEGHITNCYSTSDVNEVVMDYWYIANPTIEDFYDNSYISGMYASICGANLRGSITNCYGNDIIASSPCDECNISDEVLNCFWNDGSEVAPENADAMWVPKSEMLLADTFINAGWDESVWLLNDGELPELVNVYLRNIGITGIEIVSDNDILFAGDTISCSLLYDNDMKLNGKNIFWNIVVGSDDFTIRNGTIIQLRQFFDPVVIECQASMYTAGTYHTTAKEFTVYPYGWNTNSYISSVHMFSPQAGVPDQWISIDIDNIDLGANDVSTVNVRLVDNTGRNVADISSMPGGIGYNTFNYDSELNSFKFSIKGRYDFINIVYPLIVKLAGSDFNETCFAFDEDTVFQLPDNMGDVSFNNVVINRTDTNNYNYTPNSRLTIKVDNYLSFYDSVPLKVLFENEDGESIDVTGSVDFSIGYGGEYGYIDAGAVYNVNNDNKSQRLNINCAYISGGITYYDAKIVNLLPDYQSTQLTIADVSVKASTNRNKPNDSIEMEIKDFIIPTSYPKYTQWASGVDIKDIVVSDEITFSIEDKNGIPVNGFPKTYQCDQFINDYMVEEIVVNSPKNEKFKFQFINGSSIQLRGQLNVSLKKQDLTGLSAPFKVVVSSDDPICGFNAVGYAYDSSLRLNEDGQVVLYKDVINKRKSMPIILLNGREDTVSVSKFVVKNVKGYYRDSLKASGSFTVADIENFDPKLLYIQYGTHQDYCDKITKVNNGFIVKDKVYSENSDRKVKVLDLYARFNMKTMKFNIKIKNADDLPVNLGSESFNFEFLDADITTVEDKDFIVENWLLTN